ncbi:MAG: carbohydrate binding domain-containing protein [Armatimonadetes bacterium]|nr:carbohydrate binding domain-containing protein [Armatimonadota bacterium]
MKDKDGLGKRHHAFILAILAFILCILLSSASFGANQPFADLTLPARNYVNNGGFERGTEGWEAFAGRTFGGVVTDEHHSGDACYRATGVLKDYNYLNQTPVPLTPGKTYTLSAWMKCAGFKRAGANSQVLNLTNYGWTKSASLGPTKPDEDWTRYEVTFQAPPTSEQGGRPTYTLVVFWPIGSEGTVWIDDIQIEEADKATEFTDSYVGWALQALETLRRARTEADGLKKNLVEGDIHAPEAFARRVDEAIKATEDVAAQLRQYASLPVAEAKGLLDRTTALAGDISALSSLVFLANPYLPVGEVALPEQQPDDLTWAMTCLQGEHRATALTVANLGTRAETARFVAGDLFDETRQVRVVGTPWLSMYSAPPLRGIGKPGQRFTDPLVPLGDGGVWALLPGEVNQAVLVCDTGALAPGTYRGEVELQSLTRQAPPRTVAVTLTVVPVALAPLSGIAVCDIGAMADYALDSIGPLSVNTFSVPAQWLVPGVDEAGKVTVDLRRVAELLRPRLARCPEGRVWLGFGVGAVVAGHLKRNCGIGMENPKFTPVFSDWVKTVVAGFGEMGLPPDRLIFETVDEPGAGQLAEAATLAKLIKAAAPQALTMTYVTGFEAGNEAAMKMVEAHDIIAPGFRVINADVMATLRKLGKQVWVYDCQNQAETFHPITYYRLMPWLAQRWGLVGWGHFSMLNSERGRNYEPWQGVAEESLVYPREGGGQVISRRWLALQAGTEDVRVRQSLAKLGKPVPSDRLDQALALAKPGRDYFTGLQPGADAGLLDTFRDEAATLAEQAATPMQGKCRLTVEPGELGKTLLNLDLPQPARATLRYLWDHRAPWRTIERDLPRGQSAIELLNLPMGDGITRCVVQLVGPNGSIHTEYTPAIPRVSVDSSVPPYTPVTLNDGIAMPGMKFEPEWGWISGGAATEHWVEARLDAPMAIRGVRVWWMTFYGLPQAIKLQVWRDGAWADAPGYEQWRPAKSAVEELTMPPVTTDRVRVVQQAGGGNRAFANLMGMSEIEIVEGRGR